jgi:hypothetical protein
MRGLRVTKWRYSDDREFINNPHHLHRTLMTHIIGCLNTLGFNGSSSVGLSGLSELVFPFAIDRAIRTSRIVCARRSHSYPTPRTIIARNERKNVPLEEMCYEMRGRSVLRTWCTAKRTYPALEHDASIDDSSGNEALILYREAVIH